MQRNRFHAKRHAGLAVLALAATPFLANAQSARSAPAQGSEGALYHAYYLEHEGGDLEEALDLYRTVADNRRVAPELREKAGRFAEALAEDLATSDFARLMPADTIFYAELNRPGEQLGGLLEKLGLMKEDGDLSGGFGLSPALLKGALGIRGAAIAITEIDPSSQMPRGVVILHPGHVDMVRGLLETSIPASGTPVESIGGYPTFNMQGQALVTLTSRLVVAGSDAGAIAGVLERLNGNAHGSLAENGALHQAMSGRERDLFYFCINPEPVMPMLQGMLQQQAARDPQTALALSMLDLDSLVGIAGRLAVDEEGLALDVSMHLEEGHQNLLFNLSRMPSVQRRTLEMIPEGAAFFLATAFNDPAPAGAAVASHGNPPAISMMDFGREIFGNLVDLAVFAMPPQGDAQRGAMPDVAAILRVNNVARSKALWSLLLGIGSQATSSARTIEPEHVEIDGFPVDVFDMGHAPVFMATLEDGLVISPSRNALKRTFRSLERRRSIVADGAFANALAHIDDSSTFAAMIHPGRCAALAEGMVPSRTFAQVAPMVPLMGDMVITLGFEHSDTHAALRARVENVPDISGFVNQMIEQQRSGTRQAWARSTAAPAPAPARPTASKQTKATPSELRARFDQLAINHGDPEAATLVGKKLVATLSNDPKELNNLAWALLTEDRYGENYDEFAFHVSLLSNEESDYDNWYYLDTLGLACFRVGKLEQAVEFQKKALQRAAGNEGAADVEASLERYLKALKKMHSLGAVR